MLQHFKVPKKYSYPKRPITVTAEVCMVNAKLTRQIKRKILNRTTELAGTVPYDWFMDPGWQHFVAFFGFDTWEQGLAAEEQLKDSIFATHSWSESEELQIVGNLMRNAEAENPGEEAEFFFGDEKHDWRNDPRFAEKKSN